MIKTYPLRLHDNHFKACKEKNMVWFLLSNYTQYNLKPYRQLSAFIWTVIENTHQHRPPWPIPKTPGVKVGNSLCGRQQLFVSKYISKVSNVCGNMEDSGTVQVKLELGGQVWLLVQNKWSSNFYILYDFEFSVHWLVFHWYSEYCYIGVMNKYLSFIHHLKAWWSSFKPFQ